MTAVKNLEIERGARWYQAVTLNTDMVGKTLVCVIKESTATATYLFRLTEANGGIVLLDDVIGKFALFIPANQTDVDAYYGVYIVAAISETDLTGDKDFVLEGKIRFKKGFGVFADAPPLPEEQDGYAFSDDDKTQIYYTDDAKVNPLSNDDADLT